MLCAPYTQQGDLIVVVVCRLDVPVLLRRINDSRKHPPRPNSLVEKYRLVGQCYAHGVMNREALSMEIEAKKIEII